MSECGVNACDVCGRVCPCDDALERAAEEAARLLGNASLAFDDHDPMGRSMRACEDALRAALAATKEATP